MQELLHVLNFAVGGSPGLVMVFEVLGALIAGRSGELQQDVRGGKARNAGCFVSGMQSTQGTRDYSTNTQVRHKHSIS